MLYHRVNKVNCLEVATISERVRLGTITDFTLLTDLAKLWCNKNGYAIGGYLGSLNWDATKDSPWSDATFDKK